MIIFLTISIFKEVVTYLYTILTVYNSKYTCIAEKSNKINSIKLRFLKCLYYWNRFKVLCLYKLYKMNQMSKDFPFHDLCENIQETLTALVLNIKVKDVLQGILCSRLSLTQTWRNFVLYEHYNILTCHEL